MLSVNGGILNQDVTGVQRYALEILSHIIDIHRSNSLPNDRLKIIGLGHTSLDETPLRMYTQSTPALPRPIWTQLMLPLYAKGTLLSLGNIGPIAYKNQILCIHDANTHIAPESYSLKFRTYYKTILPIVARRVRHLVTVSEFSRVMLRNYGISGNREIHVIPNGHEHVLRWDKDQSHLKTNEILRRPYVLMIGSRARHKNIKVIEFISNQLLELGVDLVVVGRVGKHFQEVESSGRQNITMLGPVNDNDLAFLYTHAMCLAFPSLTEGFGLPALEAMTLGCPVVASNVASMPEVCGHAALYADPNDPQSWYKQIERLFKEKSLRHDLSSAGKERSRIYTWASGAEKYIELARLDGDDH